MPKFAHMRSTSLATAAALVLVAGCGSSKLPEYGKKAPVVYKRIVSMSPSASEICGAAFSRILIGRTAACNSPGGIKAVPVMTNGTEPDLDKIKAAKPDCIVYDRDELDTKSAEMIEGTGIPVFKFGGDSIDEFVDSIYAFGRVSGSEELGSKYVDKILLERAVAIAERPGAPVKIAVIRQDNFNQKWIAGTDGFVADVLTVSGGRPIGPVGKGWTQWDPAWLASQNPQILIVAGPLTGISDNAVIAGTSAVTRERVFQVDADLPTRRGSRVDRFIKLCASLIKKGP